MGNQDLHQAYSLLFWMLEYFSRTMEDRENELKEEVSFLKEKVSFFRAGFFTTREGPIHTYIQLKPGINGSPILADRALLASGSPIFKYMLESDVCKATPEDTITLPEFNHEELECLLEFLYNGSLPKEKVDQHVISLSQAADKYDIPYLQKFCERHMLRSLNSSNALDVLEISDIFSYTSLKKAALDFIVKNVEDITLSARYEEFARKNAHLALQITRSLVKGAKNN
ncbi:BTB/POZ domain-containing protein At3g56230-like isoform X2 [Corylus avellana]|uniref:BTB/POZ domain-containing protein At3g56230-like isoform X2 n=1 Tax=Corylus avellana TaxID=13451 RepID=UPI00286C7DF8|nr:BTB/POZ domain-containing protein At3g56230-like isoform X2 [Corylus avellana]